MYRDHNGFQPPAHPDTRIWRYVDFAKFMALLHNSTLYFASLGLLADQFEGALPDAQVERLVAAYDVLYRENRGVSIDQALLSSWILKDYYQRRNRTFVNCWHMNEYESGAMWRIYGDNAIAIQSTYTRLRDSFSIDAERDIHIGVVRYVDFDAWTPGHAETSGALQKRTMYDFERELRAVVYSLTSDDASSSPRGLDMAVDLGTLIERVYIGPGRQDWFVQLVRDMLDCHHLNNTCVERSGMDGKPMCA